MKIVYVKQEAVGFQYIRAAMKRLALLTVLWISTLSLCAQRSEHSFKGTGAFSVPFTYEQDFIVVQVTLDDRVPLRLLVDTGSEFTIIFSKYLTDLLGLEYHREIELLGSDMSRRITAHITERVSLELSPRARLKKNVLVIESSDIQMDKMLGMDIDGILGVEAFKDMVLHIDYKKSRLRVHPSKDIKRLTRKHSPVPTLIDRNKPYLYTGMRIADIRQDSILILMDSGSAIPFMLYTESMEDMELPSHLTSGILGIGLGGYVQGYKGRIRSLEVGDTRLENLVTNFHTADTVISRSIDIPRHGLIGNRLLAHMDPVIDFSDEQIYLHINEKAIANKAVDRSGLFVVASGANFKSYHIIHVGTGSPAEAAGLKKGDIIRSINGRKVRSLDVKRITKRLQARAGRVVRLRILRGQKAHDFEIVLADII